MMSKEREREHSPPAGLLSYGTQCFLPTEWHGLGAPDRAEGH